MLDQHIVFSQGKYVGSFAYIIIILLGSKYVDNKSAYGSQVDFHDFKTNYASFPKVTIDGFANLGY